MSEVIELPQTNFMNATSFQLKIEDVVTETGMTYLEAVLEFCNDNDFDYADVKKLLTVNLKDKIKNDAMEDGLMKMESKLPI